MSGHTRGARAVRSHPSSPPSGYYAHGPEEALRYLNLIYREEGGTKVLSVELTPRGWVPGLLWDVDTGEVGRDPKPLPREVCTRAEALARGWSRYRSGKLCKHGHDGDRYVNSYTCVQCSADGNTRRAK